MLGREREAEIAKVEYMAMAHAAVVGVDAKVFKQKMELLQDLKTTMSEIVHQDVYLTGYERAHKRKAVNNAVQQSQMLKKLQELGKGK